MANQTTIKETKISIGDIIRLHQSIKEKDKERMQIFEGRIISIKGRSPNQSFTVRRMGIDKVGIERIFPVNLPSIVKIEVKKSIPAKRAKLYNLRRKA